MSPDERDEIEQLAEDVCTATLWGHHCLQTAGHAGRHWDNALNWPDGLSDVA